MKQRVKVVMGQVFGVPPERLPDNASMDTLDTWDSVKHMGLVLALEQEFHVHLSEQGIGEMLSFPLILAVLKEHGVQ